MNTSACRPPWPLRGLVLICALFAAFDTASAQISPQGRDSNELPRADSLDQQVEALYQAGWYFEGLPLAEVSLALREAALGPGHPDVAFSLDRLARLLRGEGDFDSARALFERALALREAALGPEHPDVAYSLDNLAWLRRDEGDYAAARLLHERALALREASLGREHSDVAHSLDNLAWLFRDEGDHAASRAFFERALALREAALGPEHPDVAYSLDNLAWLRRDEGDYAAARLLHERALALREASLGREHSDVAHSLDNLAWLLRDEGDYAAAQAYFERALAVRVATLGPEHPVVANSRDNLALHLRDQELYAAGDTVIVETGPPGDTIIWVEDSTAEGSLPAGARLDPQPMDRARDLMAEGSSRHASGNYERAWAAYAQAVAILEGVLREDHWELAVARYNLAHALWHLHEYEDALRVLEPVLPAIETEIGRDHTATAEVLIAIAQAHLGLRDAAAARPNVERAVEIFQQSGTPAELARALGIAADLHEMAGDHREATRLRGRAQAVLGGGGQ